MGRTTICPHRDDRLPPTIQGQWFDEESELHYNFNRYYDPHTSSYLSSDMNGLDAGPRSYGYVVNPLIWVDPFGLAPLQGVDFGGSPNLYPVTGGQQNVVSIPMQGSRGRDFTQAYKESGVNQADADGYTWHHVDDFNPDTGSSTMQLVSTDAHEATYPTEALFHSSRRQTT